MILLIKTEIVAFQGSRYPRYPEHEQNKFRALKENTVFDLSRKLSNIHSRSYSLFLMNEMEQIVD